MNIDVDIFTLVKMATKLASHRAQQRMLTTNETEIRETADGQIKGVKRKTIYDDFYFAFEGIPYAKPPTGERRFRAPQPVDRWEEVLDCTDCKSKPIQEHMLLPIVEGSEDCLYLNVYVKNLKSQTPLPVIIWIHGGGFTVGEASRDYYAPDYFMMHNVVLVTITYRLSVFGFLSLNDPDLDVPGNAGIKDQIMALKWIKNNIQIFNGDANNITLMGDSAGAASTHILMTCPQTKHCFHKAIMMSGSAYNPWCFFPQHDMALRLACQLGYKGANCDKQIFSFLTKIEGRKLVNACSRLINKEERRNLFLFPFAPTIEPYESESAVMTKPFLEAYRTAWGHEIPLLLGGTSFEGLFLYQTPKKYPYVINEMGDCEDVIPYDARIGMSKDAIRSNGLEIKKLFFNNEQPNLENHFQQYLDLSSYTLIWNGVYRALLSRLAYAKEAATYLYRFDFDSPHFNHYRILKCGPKQRGVSHADDMSYLFYNIAASKLSVETAEYKTIKRFTGMFVAFAQTSNPNCQEILPIQWQPVSSNNKIDVKCLNISEELEILTLPEYEKLELFSKMYTKESLI